MAEQPLRERVVLVTGGGRGRRRGPAGGAAGAGAADGSRARRLRRPHGSRAGRRRRRGGVRPRRRAGGQSRTLEPQALEQLTGAELDLSYAVNTRATLLLVKAFAAQHDGRDGGRVVLLTSGQYAGPMPDELPYIASKGALHQVTASLACHLAPRRITVNTVDPGATDTGYASRAAYDAVLAEEPMARWGQPDDAARLIAWLASDDARWVTGQVIASNGGGP
jgi:NAD(P)-dependent dehydrogenase (short-subunit alcohol dehydrogenase family)